MTSRKNQRAARQYMREHDVPYMEAMRRVAASAKPRQAVSQSLFPEVTKFRDPNKPLILGYTAHRKESAEQSQQPEGEPNISIEPYMIEPAEGKVLPFVTVYGPPGSGKTMLVRTIMEQYRGYAAYVVGGRELVQTPSSSEGVEPWEGLVHVNLTAGLYGADLEDRSIPPASVRGLKEALVVLDLGGFGYLDAYDSRIDAERRALIEKWKAFEEALNQLARSYRITVVKTVMTGDMEHDQRTPLHELTQAFWGSTGVMVRTEYGYSPSGRSRGGKYEALRSGTMDHFTLTREEASQRA